MDNSRNYHDNTNIKGRITFISFLIIKNNVDFYWVKYFTNME